MAGTAPRGPKTWQSEVPDSLPPGFCRSTVFELLKAASTGLKVACCIMPLIPSDAEYAPDTAEYRCCAVQQVTLDVQDARRLTAHLFFGTG